MFLWDMRPNLGLISVIRQNFQRAENGGNQSWPHINTNPNLSFNL